MKNKQSDLRVEWQTKYDESRNYDFAYQTTVLVTERKSPCGERIHKEHSKVKGEWQLLKLK